MNVVIALYDNCKNVIVNKIMQEKIFNVVGIIPTSYTMKQIENKRISMPFFTDIKNISDKIDKCIVLNNSNIKKSVVFEMLNEYFRAGIDVDCYYAFTDEEIKNLKANAERCNVHFDICTDLSADESVMIKTTNQEINIPIIYISGLHEKCNVFESHLMVHEILQKYGYNVLNISNSVYSKLFNFLSLYTLFNPKEINLYATIREARNKIAYFVEEKEANVIVISNLSNFVNFEGFLENYGMDNFIIKNMLDIDLVIFNLPINLINNMDDEKIADLEESIMEETCRADVYLGMAHVILDKYFDDRFYFLPTERNEFMKCFNELKAHVRVFDSLGRDDLKKIVLVSE